MKQRKRDFFRSAKKQMEQDKLNLKLAEASFQCNGDTLRLFQQQKLEQVVSRYYPNTAPAMLRDFSRIPFLTRGMLKDSYPMGLVKTDTEKLVRYGESTGTTKNPISACYTINDWHFNNQIVGGFLSELVSDEDIVMVVVPYALAMVAQDVDRALEMIGAVTVGIGTIGEACSIQRLLSILVQTKATAIVCSPTRALFIAHELREEGYDIRSDCRVNKLLCVGEGMSDAKKGLLEQAWGGAKVYPMYGMTETNTLAMPCNHGSLHLAENKAFFELVDEQGNPVREGNRGELVVTTFFEGMPLLRYRTGDICTIHREACKCGLSMRKITHHGRKTDVVQIGGHTVAILDLEQVILECSGCMYYRLSVKGETLEVGLALSGREIEQLKQKLERKIYRLFHLDSSLVPIRKEEIIDKIRHLVKPTVLGIYQ